MRSALQFRQVCSPSPTKWSNRARFCCMALRSLLALNCRAGRRQRRQLLGVKQSRPWLDRAAVIDPACVKTHRLL